MRKHIVLVVALVVLVAPAAAAAKDCRDVAGGFSAGPPAPGTCTSFFCTEGVLEGGLKGSYFFTATGVTPTGGLTGASTITLRSGMQLFGSDVSELGAPNAEGLIPFTTTVNIVGGTGKFDDASGQIVATGLLDPVAGTTIGDYTGSVCKK
jgi:hypothetical protein